MPMEHEQPQYSHVHFVVVTYPAQGHINPARHLAHRLARSTGARVTISTAVSAHRKMFPAAADADADDDVQESTDGSVGYIPYSDGYDDGFDRDKHDYRHYMAQTKLVGSRTLSAILRRLDAEGRPATCVVYTLLLPWAADAARAHGVPSALYWIQPATVLAAYHHYFHGHDAAVAAVAHDPYATVRFPGLPPLKVRDLPSFLALTSADHPYATVLASFRDLFKTLERESQSNQSTRPTILVNTFDAMEADALKSVEHVLNVIAIGPVLSFSGTNTIGRSNDLFEQDEKQHYLAWLDTIPAKSVVYISFGSMSLMTKNQIAEIAQGIKESGRPFLWVIRKDNRNGEEANICEELGRNGMIVEWCNQVEVLSHPSIGCFVTHCGWNSTLESITCGVPIIGVPQWTDQGTNAWLVEQLGIGVRGTVNEKDGILGAEELKRCLERVMTEEVRKNAEMWKEKAQAAITEGGSSDRNLRVFVGDIAWDN